MKSIFFLPAAIIIFIFSANGQNIGIGTNTPAPSAKLEISDSAKGILIPRVDATHRLAIITPAKGLMIYETTSESFWFL